MPPKRSTVTCPKNFLRSLISQKKRYLHLQNRGAVLFRWATGHVMPIADCLLMSKVHSNDIHAVRRAFHAKVAKLNSILTVQTYEHTHILVIARV